MIERRPLPFRDEFIQRRLNAQSRGIGWDLSYLDFVDLIQDQDIEEGAWWRLERRDASRAFTRDNVVVTASRRTYHDDVEFPVDSDPLLERLRAVHGMPPPGSVRCPG